MPAPGEIPDDAPGAAKTATTRPPRDTGHTLLPALDAGSYQLLVGGLGADGQSVVSPYTGTLLKTQDGATSSQFVRSPGAVRPGNADEGLPRAAERRS